MNKALRTFLFFALGVFLACSAGCVNIRQYTRIFPDGRCVDKMDLTVPSLIAAGMGEKMKDLKGQGYQVDEKSEDDKITFSIKKEFATVKDLYASIHRGGMGADVTGGKENKRRGDLKIHRFFILTTYEFNEIIEPPAGAAAAQSSGSQVERQVEEASRQMMKGLLTFARSVEMPGEIVSHNASSVKGSTAIWILQADSLEQIQTLTVKSRVIHLPVIVGLIVVLLGILTGVLRMKKRR